MHGRNREGEVLNGLGVLAVDTDVQDIVRSAEVAAVALASFGNAGLVEQDLDAAHFAHTQIDHKVTVFIVDGVAVFVLDGELFPRFVRNEVGTEAACRSVVEHDVDKVGLVRLGCRFTAAEHILKDVVNERFLRLFDVVGNGVEVRLVVRDLVVRITDGTHRDLAVVVHEHLPVLGEVILFVLLHIGVHCRRPVGIEFVAEQALKLVDIRVHLIGERIRIAFAIVLRPVLNLLDTRLRTAVHRLIEVVLAGGAVRLLRTVLRKALDVDGIHRRGSRIGRVEIHIDVVQDVLIGKRRAVAELHIVFDGKVVVGIVAFEFVDAAFLALVRRRTRRHDAVRLGDAGFVVAGRGIAVFIARKHSDLRHADHFAVRAGCIEERIEHAVEQIAGQRKRGRFIVACVLCAGRKERRCHSHGEHCSHRT